MAILAFDHVNIRTRDPKRTLAFFRDALLMKTAPSPFSTSSDGGWVYDENDLPIVHVGSADRPYPTDEMMPFTPAEGGGAVHHVALRCSDFEGTRDRLQSMGLPIKESGYSPMNLRQIFVSDPNGLIFELNFRD